MPAHWPLEVANALLIARRRGRVTADQISEFIAALFICPAIVPPPAPSLPPVPLFADLHTPPYSTVAKPVTIL